MALVLANRVQETTTTTGTGTITLAGAVSGFQSFAAIGNTNTTYYTITSGVNWEVGVGTYTLSGTTLARTTVLSSSAGGTTKITLAGTSNVFATYPAEKSVNLDASGNATALGVPASGTVTNLTGTASININGTVGATTAAAGLFTTLGASAAVTLSPANANVVLSPTGTGVVTISPATAGTINRMSIGATTTSTGAFTTLTASGAVTLSPASANVVMSPTGTGVVTISPATAGTINNMSIGATTTSTGAFTTLAASSTVSGTGFSTYLASPPAIGGTAAAAGTFTTLTATGAVALSPANLNVVLSPTGTGVVTISPATAGTINRMSIGATTTSTGAFTTLTASGAVTLSPASANVVLSPTGTGVVTISPATAGTINNMSIGATTTSTGAFTTISGSTSLTTPLQSGGTAVSSTLTLQSTSGAGTSDAIIFKTASQTERMRITTGGDVGIGTATPNSRLHVSYTNDSATAFTGFALSSLASTTGRYLPSIIWAYGSTGTPTFASIDVLRGSSSGGIMVFNSADTAGTNTERMRITSAGDVGIGNTPSGTFKLEVTGAVSASTSLTTPLHSGGTAVSSTLTLQSTSGAGTSDAIIFKTGSQVEQFRVLTGGGITSAALVDAVGYKGLPQNSQTASYTLALTDMGKMVNTTTGGIVIPANSSVAFPTGSTVIVYNNSASNQTISITTDTIYLAGTATTGSRTLAQRGLATLVKVASTTWVASGAGVT